MTKPSKTSAYARRRVRLRSTLFGWALSVRHDHGTREDLASAVEAHARELASHGLAPRDWWAAIKDATDNAWQVAMTEPAPELVDEGALAFFAELRTEMREP